MLCSAINVDYLLALLHWYRSNSMAAYFIEIVLTVFLLTLYNAFAYDLTILHTNDVHGRITQFDSGTVRCSLASANAGDCFGGAARIQTVVKQTRTEIDNVLLLDGGDQFQGTTWFHYYQGDATAHFMNKIGYDAMAIGNHEFDLGPEVLARFLRNVNFDVVSANVDVSNETSLQGLFTKSVIKDVNGERIGIVGYTYRDTPVLSQAAVGAAVFEDEIETVQREVDMLIDKGIDMIIGLGHSGYEVDLEVAARVRGVDIVVGGHSDTFLYTGTPPSTDIPQGEYPTVVTQTHDSTRRVLVVQDYARAKYLGRLDVVFDDEGEVVEYSGNPILLDDTVEQDPDILTDISIWGAPIRDISNQVIGRSNVILQGAFETCCSRECNIGNLLTDAYVRAFVPDKASDQGWTNVTVAIELCGSIRGSINQGDILFEDVVGVLPFQNTIDAIDIRGSDLKSTLEIAVAGSTFQGEFMQFSGILVTYDISKNPYSRVVEALVLCSDCVSPEYQPIVDDRIYRIAVSSYFYLFLKDVAINHQTGSIGTTVVRQYIEQFSPIITPQERRIRFVEQPATPSTSPPTMVPTNMKMRKYDKNGSPIRKTRKQ